MNKPLTNKADRNFVKYCIALQALKGALSTFIKKQSEEQCYWNFEYIKIKCGVSAHTCTDCNLRPSGATCAPNKCAQNGACDVLFQRLQSKHVTQHPNWSNVRWELLSSSSWEQLKCFITDSGYTDVVCMEDAGINAFVQICCNHCAVNQLVAEDIRNLQKIVQTQDEVFQSEEVRLTDEESHRHIQEIRTALQINSINSTPDIQSHLDVIYKLLSDERLIVVEDEIWARLQVIAYLNRCIASSEYLQTEYGTSNNDYGTQIRLMSFTKEINCHRLRTRFEEVESFLDQLKQESKINEEKLIKQRNEASKLGLNESLQNSAVGAIGMRTAGYNVPNIKHMQDLQMGTYDDVKEVLNGVDKNGRSIQEVGEGVRALNSLLLDHIALSQLERHVPLTDLLMKITTVGATNNETLSGVMVEAGNGLLNGVEFTDAPRRQLQILLRRLLDNLERDGNIVTRIRHGCMAIYICCRTVNNLIALCEDFLSGKLTSLFQPLQDYLRTVPDNEDVEVVVNIFERDYLNCIIPMIHAVQHKMDLRLQALLPIAFGRITVLQNEPTRGENQRTESDKDDENAILQELPLANLRPWSEEKTKSVGENEEDLSETNGLVRERLQQMPDTVLPLALSLSFDSHIKENANALAAKLTRTVQDFDNMICHEFKDVFMQMELMFTAINADDVNVPKLADALSNASGALVPIRDTIMAIQGGVHRDIETCRQTVKNKKMEVDVNSLQITVMEQEVRLLQGDISGLQKEARFLAESADKIYDRAVEAKKNLNSVGGGGLAAFFTGLALAPFTGGTSLILTAAGGVGAGAALTCTTASELHDEANETRRKSKERANDATKRQSEANAKQQTIDEKRMKIKTANSDIERLNEDVAKLQRMIDYCCHLIDDLNQVLSAFQDAKTTLTTVHMHSELFTVAQVAFKQNPEKNALFAKKNLQNLKTQWEEMNVRLCLRGIKPT